MRELLADIIRGLLIEVDDAMDELIKQKLNLLDTLDELSNEEPLDDVLFDIHDYVYEQDDDD